MEDIRALAMDREGSEFMSPPSPTLACLWTLCWSLKLHRLQFFLTWTWGLKT